MSLFTSPGVLLRQAGDVKTPGINLPARHFFFLFGDDIVLDGAMGTARMASADGIPGYTLINTASKQFCFFEVHRYPSLTVLSDRRF